MTHTDITPPSSMPKVFWEGDTFDFNVSGGKYTPNDGWDLTVYFSGPSNMNATGSVSAADSGSWTVTVAKEKSELLEPGIYQWQAIVTSGSEQRSIQAGNVRVRQSVKNATAGSLVTHAQKMLDLLEAAIVYRLTGQGGIDDISIQGQSVKHMDIVQLRELRAEYFREVQAELYGRSSTKRNNIGVVFLLP